MVASTKRVALPLVLRTRRAVAEVQHTSVFLQDYSFDDVVGEKKHGFSRVMTRPADRVRRYKKTRGSNRVGPGGVGNPTGRVGSGLEVFKYYGSDRVTLTRSDPREGIPPAKSPEKERYCLINFPMAP